MLELEQEDTLNESGPLQDHRLWLIIIYGHKSLLTEINSRINTKVMSCNQDYNKNGK